MTRIDFGEASEANNAWDEYLHGIEEYAKEEIIEAAAALHPSERPYLAHGLATEVDALFLQTYRGSEYSYRGREYSFEMPEVQEVPEKLSPGQEAHQLVYGERAATYGHPREDFRIIAKVWTGLLQDVLKPGAEIDEYRIAIMMSGLKLSRLVKSPKHHDSRVDTCGYMETMERLDEPEGN